MKKNELLEGPILSSLLKLAVPIMIANLLQAAYQLVDAFWVGRLGGDAVAAVSVSTPVIFLTIALGTGLAIAGSILIAQYFGAGQQEMVNHVAAQTLLMVITVSIGLSIIGYLLSPYFLYVLKVTPQVYADALGFMRVAFVGLVFSFGFMIFQSIMRGVGRVTLPVYIVLGTVILNFALDPIFIFGWKFIPPMGVKGAALATLSTQSLAIIIGFAILFRGKHGIHLKLSDFRPDYKHVKKAFKIGFPSSIEQSMRALGMMAITFLIVHFGTTTVASYGAGSNLIQLILIPALGLSMAIATLVGQNIGAGNIARAAEIGKLGTYLGFGLLTAIGVIAYIFAPYLIAFFVPDEPEVISGGTTFLRITCLSWGFLGLQMCLLGVFRAVGNTTLPMILTLVSQWVLQFPIAYILSHNTNFGKIGIWYAFPISTVVTALITLIIYAKGDWKKERLTGKTNKLIDKVEKEIVKEGF
ncbi:putative MATE family efflux protein [Flavobacterium sp. 270]|uniref:MATE family efflux transporter n=1 Tax=Flavobacterium sp. 270 TaxID=2512114 RepID=UPI00106508F0|nr:MATE family efflux transporter [Flavobacterium sp. 270]TDW48080.1 putative MATE family efflux protein [Flavobacterium sp. 270]